MRFSLSLSPHLCTCFCLFGVFGALGGVCVYVCVSVCVRTCVGMLSYWFYYRYFDTFSFLKNCYTYYALNVAKKFLHGTIKV